MKEPNFYSGIRNKSMYVEHTPWHSQFAEPPLPPAEPLGRGGGGRVHGGRLLRAEGAGGGGYSSGGVAGQTD